LRDLKREIGRIAAPSGAPNVLAMLLITTEKGDYARATPPNLVLSLALPAGDPTPTGCPGWPFPTLPCTEQFPPSRIAGSPAPPAQSRPNAPSPLDFGDLPFLGHTQGLPALPSALPPKQPAAPTPSPFDLDTALADWRQLDAELNRLIAGNVAFNTPNHMRVGKSRIIEAKLSVNISPDALIKQVTEAGEKVSASLRVANRMSAMLSGGGLSMCRPPVRNSSSSVSWTPK
jgi:hypothetical protein